MSVSPKNVLVVRTDNLGDLILTAPLQNWLTQNFLVNVYWLVDQRFAYVLERGGVSPDKIIGVSRATGFLSRIRSIFELSKTLKKIKFDGACVCFCTWPIAAALFVSRIPVRVGVFSKLWSWVFYTYPVRQKRSQAVRHESEYNLEVAREFVCEMAVAKDGIFRRGSTGAAVDLHAADTEGSWNYFKLHTLNGKMKDSLPSNFVVLHPGMSGSALNWSAKKYHELAQKILSTNMSVVVTGTESDRAFINECGIEKLSGVTSLVGKTNGDQILEVLSLAKAVVAPSTGVLHLAASLGVPTLGIYSPVRVEHPTRWGPKGPRVEVVVADLVRCPRGLCDLGEKCVHFDYMDTILVDKVFGRLTNVMDTK